MQGNRLRQLRESLGISQEDFAKAIGISEPTVWRAEHNESVRSDVLVRIAEYLNVSTDYLLGIDDKMGDLTPRETTALAAWRRGERLEAIKAIVGDE